MRGLIELIIDILIDNAGFPHRLIAQKDNFDLDLAADCTNRAVHEFHLMIIYKFEIKDIK